MSFVYIAVTLFVFPAYITCVSYGILWIVMRIYKEQYLENHSPKLFFKAMSVSWVSMYIFFLLTFRRKIHSIFQGRSNIRGEKTPPPKKRKNIIFIHGAYHNESAWDFFDPIVRELQGIAGFRFHYDIGNKGLPTLAVELDQFIRKSVKQSGLSEVVLVGHSLGGLLGRYWFAQHRQESETDYTDKDILSATDIQVRGIITLSTPHGGMLLAHLGLAPLFRELTPYGSVIRDLENQEKRLGPCPSIYKFALYSPFDNMVTPLSCLKRFPSDWRVKVLPGLSHLGLLWHPQALKAFRDTLRSIFDEPACSFRIGASKNREISSMYAKT